LSVKKLSGQITVQQSGYSWQSDCKQKMMMSWHIMVNESVMAVAIIETCDKGYENDLVVRSHENRTWYENLTLAGT